MALNGDCLHAWWSPRCTWHRLLSFENDGGNSDPTKETDACCFSRCVLNRCCMQFAIQWKFRDQVSIDCGEEAALKERQLARRFASVQEKNTHRSACARLKRKVPPAGQRSCLPAHCALLAHCFVPFSRAVARASCAAKTLHKLSWPLGINEMNLVVGKKGPCTSQILCAFF